MLGQLDWISNALAKPVAPPSADDSTPSPETELAPAEPEISEVFETPEEAAETELSSAAAEPTESAEPASDEEPTDEDS